MAELQTFRANLKNRMSLDDYMLEASGQQSLRNIPSIGTLNDLDTYEYIPLSEIIIGDEVVILELADLFNPRKYFRGTVLYSGEFSGTTLGYNDKTIVNNDAYGIRVSSGKYLPRCKDVFTDSQDKYVVFRKKYTVIDQEIIVDEQ